MNGNQYSRGFNSLWGPNGTKTVILIYDKHIINHLDAWDERSSPA